MQESSSSELYELALDDTVTVELDAVVIVVELGDSVTEYVAEVESVALVVALVVSLAL